MLYEIHEITEDKAFRSFWIRGHSGLACYDGRAGEKTLFQTNPCNPFNTLR